MADFSHIPNFHLKIVFIIHFMLTALASLGYWSASSYLYYNSVLIVTLLWTIHENESGEPLRLAIFVNGISIVLDIILLVLCFPSSGEARERFSAAIAILQLITRPFTTLYLAKLLQDGVGMSGGIGNVFAGARSRNYEDMDKNVPQEPRSQGGYDFAQAQQL